LTSDLEETDPDGSVPICRECGVNTFSLRCRWCGASRDRRTIFATFVLPPLLSMLIPGLGQLAKRRGERAFVVFVAAAIALVLSIGGAVFPYPLFWLWNIFDAFRLE
jgi:hypothetical protein